MLNSQYSCSNLLIQWLITISLLVWPFVCLSCVRAPSIISLRPSSSQPSYPYPPPTASSLLSLSDSVHLPPSPSVSLRLPPSSSVLLRLSSTWHPQSSSELESAIPANMFPPPPLAAFLAAGRAAARPPPILGATQLVTGALEALALPEPYESGGEGHSNCTCTF